MTAQPNVLGRQIARHRALAAFHRDAAESEERAAEDLGEFVEFLDARYPAWCKRWRNKK
jgi:hypothetical protein